MVGAACCAAAIAGRTAPKTQTRKDRGFMSSLLGKATPSSTPPRPRRTILAPGQPEPGVEQEDLAGGLARAGAQPPGGVGHVLGRSPRRRAPSGPCRTAPPRRSARRRGPSAIHGVSTRPGAMALTRTAGPNARAMPIVIALQRALARHVGERGETEAHHRGDRRDVDDCRTGWRCSIGISARAIWKAPMTLTP